jgi:hypothetical protein
VKRIILACIFLLALIGVGVSASIYKQTYLPIVYRQATPTPTEVPATPTATPFPPGVQVLPVSFTYKSGNMMHVVGEVFNNTNESLYGVMVTVNFFNALGYFIDTGSTLLIPFNLPERERGCFSIIMDYPPNWSYYIFDTPTYDIGSSSPDLTINAVNAWYNSDSGDYEIIGQVVNEGVQISYNVSVGGTLYNVSDEPVGCNYYDVDSINLDPGGTSTFDLFYDGLDRNYNDVTQYRLRVTGDLP